MIRTVTGSVDPAALASSSLELLGAHELLVTSPEAHACTTSWGPHVTTSSSGGKEGKEGEEEVSLTNLAAIRANPEAFLWNVQLPSIEVVQLELEEGASRARDSGCLGLVLHAAGATAQDRTPLRRLGEKLEGKVLVVAGALPALPPSASGSASAADVEKAAKLLAHHLRFGLPLVAPRVTTTTTPEGGGEEKEEDAAALRDQAQRVGLGFIGLLELRPPGADAATASRNGALLTAAAQASVETGAPILLTAQDAFGRVAPDEALIDGALSTLLALKVPPASVVLCRMPCDPALEPAYRRWLGRGVVLSLAFQGGAFYSLVPAGTGPPGATRDYPSDGEGAELVASLCKQGFGAQLLLSPGVACRLQLARYGGHGYGHTSRTVGRQLELRGVDPADLARLRRGNVVRLLAWWQAPPPVEREVEMGLCSWCGRAFELREGDYFTKFSYAYCRSKCLSAHGNTGWKPLPLDSNGGGGGGGGGQPK